MRLRRIRWKDCASWQVRGAFHADLLRAGAALLDEGARKVPSMRPERLILVEWWGLRANEQPLIDWETSQWLIDGGFHV